MQSASDLLQPSNKLHGILFLNKPTGFTSQQAVSKIKRLLKVKKAGHTGALDPIATGLLPICIGEATKFSQLLLTSDKHYRVDACLGRRTDTGDSEGRIIERKPVHTIEEKKLKNSLSRFLGDILQTPPMFSAIKQQGKPLYYWARKGIEMKRASRPISIYELKLLSYQPERLSLEVRCSKGTYIRTLIDDIGVTLGCGAYVTHLHRLSVGKYTIKDSIDFATLESINTVTERAQQLLPISEILPKEWPTFKISKAAAFYLRRGQALTLPKTPIQGPIKLLLKSDNQLIGVGQILKDGRIAPYRLINEV